MNDLVSATLGFLCVLMLVVIVWALSQSNVVAECEKLGAFYVGEKVYECRRKQ